MPAVPPAGCPFSTADSERVSGGSQAGSGHRPDSAMSTGAGRMRPLAETGHPRATATPYGVRMVRPGVRRAGLVAAVVLVALGVSVPEGSGATAECERVF